jgi:type IV pilus assembly protein PilM
VAVGGEEITREIAAQLDCSFEDAEEIKLGNAPDKMAQDELKRVVSAFISKWCREIRRVIDFYYSTSPDDDIKQILLSGGAAQTTGFLTYLASETSIEVDMLDPFKALEINKRQHDVEHLGRIAPQAAICIGLATRRVGDK